MLVSCRQNQRSQPTKPSLGWTMSGSSRGGAESMWSEGRLKAWITARNCDMSALQSPVDHQDADDDEQHAADDVDGTDVPLEERDRSGDPVEAEGDEEERDAEADAVEEAEQRAAPRRTACRR